MSKRLIYEILSSPLAIEEQRAMALMPRVLDFIAGNQVQSLTAVVGTEAGRPAPVYMSDENTIVSLNDDTQPTEEKVVAVIPIQVPIMKHDNCGDPGTATIERWVRKAGNDERCAGLILQIDSPGGTVSGTQTLVDAIKEVASKKPVIGFVDDGLMASAAYWIASACTEIIASHATDEIGSIGVFTTFADYLKAWSVRNGDAKVESIYSRLSTEKNLDYRKWLEGDNKPAQDQLDMIAREFIAAVKTNRAGKINLSEGDPFKGAIYYAPAALKIGLIDHIGNLSFSLNRVKELSKSNKSDMKKATVLPTWKGLMAFFSKGKPGADTSKEMEVSEAELTSLDAHLVELEAKNKQLSDEAAALTAERDQAKADLATVTQERETLKATIELFGKKPGADGSNPVKVGTDKIDSTEETQPDHMKDVQNAWWVKEPTNT